MALEDALASYGRWIQWGVIVTLGALFAVGARSPARTIEAGRLGAGSLSALEARVGADPNDPRSLQELVDAYLERGAPGLAQAALDRAPRELRDLPELAHRRARALTELGYPQLAFAAEQVALAGCEKTECSPVLQAHAARRLAWLGQMLRLDVEDPRRDPERALLAYRLASREVRLWIQ
jgi:hypothetical protein